MKRILSLASLLSLVAYGAQAGCASKAELQSLGMRALQSELMVAALACGKKQDYNHYIGLFSNDLKWQGQQLKSFFARTYGTGSEKELNSFVTQMANQASRLSLNEASREYCSQAEHLFEKVNSARPWQIIDYASARYAAWHSITPCAAQEVAVTTQ